MSLRIAGQVQATGLLLRRAAPAADMPARLAPVLFGGGSWGRTPRVSCYTGNGPKQPVLRPGGRLCEAAADVRGWVRTEAGVGAVCAADTAGQKPAGPPAIPPPSPGPHRLLSNRTRAPARRPPGQLTQGARGRFSGATACAEIIWNGPLYKTILV